MQLLRSPRPDERRNAAQLWEQYIIEKELAERLRNASRSERRVLYSAAYEELFRRVPHHSQLTKKASPAERAIQVAVQLNLVQRFLRPDTTFLEIGAGDCALSFAVAPRVRKVYAVDVSTEITAAGSTPGNFELRLSDGTSIPVPENCIDVAYSFQLMEHLHPDDALEQLGNIYRALAPGGVYVCLTPNRHTGPHDISRYFDGEAAGFHLKEYTAGELVALFREVGFRHVHYYLSRRGEHLRAPLAIARCLEATLALLPRSTRQRLVEAKLVRSLLDIRVVAIK
jgi:SAM-dependent methyltransferase